jgi:anthranilate synthase/aminodeoxychorismate synthase-like glutamine amidotransferase
MKVLVLDNYDSFTYNLVQYLEMMGAETDVRRNDRVTVASVEAGGYQRVLISPGPGIPSRAGITLPLVSAMAGRVPLLGVCLGHQAIGEAFGGRVIRAPAIFHGRTSEILHDGKTLFRGLSSPLVAMRYHSLVIEPETLPSCLEVSAWTAAGDIMGVRHRELPVEGVQFHPESILTPEGMKILANFLGGAPAPPDKPRGPCRRGPVADLEA